MAVRELLPFSRSSVPILRGEHPIRTFQEEMNRMFDDFFGEPSWPTSLWRRTPEASFAVTPPLDVAENEKEFIVSAEVPGMESGDVQITMADGYVTIKGEKKQEEEEEREGYFRKERSYGSFQRVIALPDAANLDKAEAVISKGVLTIHIPKKAGAQTKERKLEIRQAA